MRTHRKESGLQIEQQSAGGQEAGSIGCNQDIFFLEWIKKKMWMEIAPKVDQMHVSVRCLDVWEGPTHVHTLMSSSHTALLLYLPSLLPLFAYCACPPPITRFYSCK